MLKYAPKPGTKTTRGWKHAAECVRYPKKVKKGSHNSRDLTVLSVGVCPGDESISHASDILAISFTVGQLSRFDFDRSL